MADIIFHYLNFQGEFHVFMIVYRFDSVLHCPGFDFFGIRSLMRGPLRAHATATRIRYRRIKIKVPKSIWRGIDACKLAGMSSRELTSLNSLIRTNPKLSPRRQQTNKWTNEQKTQVCARRLLLWAETRLNLQN